MIARHLCLVLLLTMITTVSIAQKEKEPRTYYYTFDNLGEPCEANKASYVASLKEFDDTTWQFSYYKFDGPLIYVETYRDKEMQHVHGYVALFDEKGRVDTTGWVYNQRKEGWWNYYNDSLVVIHAQLYEQGKLVQEKTRQQLAAEKKQENGPDDYPATFKGNTKDWGNYLSKQLRTPERLSQLSRSGEIRVLFSVGTDGYTHDFRVIKSVEISADQEAVKVIRLSPQWRPAKKDGKLVKSWLVQPVRFNQ